jgi:hypothetical protein
LPLPFPEFLSSFFDSSAELVCGLAERLDFFFGGHGSEDKEGNQEIRN